MHFPPCGQPVGLGSRGSNKENMTKLPTLIELLKAGVHFGHQKSRWHPKMEPFLFGSRSGVHIIDLDKTLIELKKSLEQAKNFAANGKVILFIGTKRQARSLVKEAAISCEMPYLVERWIGGLLTNFDEVKRRLRRYKDMKEQIATGEVEKYTKKEQAKFKKEIDKLDRYLVGLTSLDRIPDVLYIADMRTEKTAIAEAKRSNVKIIGICDSNINPENADYIVPSNDDAINAIKIMADLFADAINEGSTEFKKKNIAEKPVAQNNQNQNFVKKAYKPGFIKR